MRADVGIGDFAVSTSSVRELKTYALGSCVALMIWDRVNKVGGMIHVALPDSGVNPEKAKTRPGYFADTGLPALFAAFAKQGGRLPGAIVKIAGGSNIMDENKTFDIGRRNVIAIKRLLWKYSLGVIKEDVGGRESRTVSFLVDSGDIRLSNAQAQWDL